MPCRQVSTFNGTAASSGSYATEAECLQACKEGACCEAGVCSVKPACQCKGPGQTFQGVGTTCSDISGACCNTTAGVTTCTIKPACECTGAGYKFLGVGSTCSSLSGACCEGPATARTCTIKTECECNSAGAVFRGVGTKCTTFPCTNGCDTPGSSCECWCKYDGGTVPNYCNVTVSGWAKRANGPQMPFSDSISVPLKSPAGSCPQWWLNDWMATDADYAGAATKGFRVNISGFVGTITSLAFKEAELSAGFVKAIDGSAFTTGSTPDASTTQTGDWAPVRADAGVQCWRSLAGKWFRNEGVTAGWPHGDSFQYDVRFQINGFA